MSRVAKKPIFIPKNVNIEIKENMIIITGKNGKLKKNINNAVKIKIKNEYLIFSTKKNYPDAWTQAGTIRSIINSMIIGVTKGFTKKLKLIGVGYRAIINERKLILSLGFSHTIEYKFPKNININCPSQNEIIIQGTDKQIVGEIASKIRSYKPPEPYKGKGICYFKEKIKLKESKKK